MLPQALGAVWLEVDVLGLHKDAFRTKRAPPRPTIDLAFEHSIAIKSLGPEAEAIRRALDSAAPQDSDLLFTAMAAGSSGNQQLGVGFVNLKELYTQGRDLRHAAVTLRGTGERRIGSVDVSVSCLGAMHRAVAPDSIRVAVASLGLPDELARDPSVAEVWVEVDLACLGIPTAVRTKALAASSNQLDFGLTHSVAAPPGSPALTSLQRALATKEEGDTDVYFVLKSRGKPPAGARGGSALAADRELAEGFVNLEAMLRERRDHVLVPISLERKGGHEPVSLTVSLLAYEALRRIKSPVPAADAIRVDVVELTPPDALLSDASISDVWIEVDVLDLDGGQPLRTSPLRKNTRGPLRFDFSHSLSVDAAKLDMLRRALASAEEQDSDVYFALKGRGPRVAERELAQGFINLAQLAREGKDHVRTAVELISDTRKPYGSVVVSVVATEVLKRAQSLPAQGSKDTIRVTLGLVELAAASRADPELLEIWAEVDFLGLGEPSPLLTPQVQRGGAAAIDLASSHVIAVPVGSRQQGTLRNAIVSAHAGDADVYVSLKGSSRRGEDRVIGQGAFNLRNDLLAHGKEMSAVPVALTGPKGAAGSVQVSVSALDALRAAVPPAMLKKIEGSAAGRATAKAAKPTTIRVDVHGLSLTPTLRADPEVGEVWVEVDLVDLGDRAALTTSRLRKNTVPLDFGFSHAVTIAPGSKEQDTLRSAMDAADEQESDVYFELKTSARGKETQVGQGFLNLRKLLEQNKDMISVPVALQGRKGPAGTLKVSVIALEALGAVSGAPAATAASAAAEPGLADDAGGVPELRVEVGNFTISQALRNNIDVSELWVEVDVLGLGDKAAMATPHLRKLVKPLDFKYSHAIEVPAGSEEEAVLRKAIEAASEQDSDVYFEVKSARKGGGTSDVGQAYLNLRKVLDEGRDVVHTAVPVSGRQGESLGTLSVSLHALDLLRTITGAGGGLASERLPRGGRSTAEGSGGGSGVSKFVGSFSSGSGESSPKARAATATARPATATARPATATARPATATARPGTATATARPGTATATATTTATATASPAGGEPGYTQRRPAAISSPGRDGAKATAVAVTRSPALQGTNSALTIRVESLTLGASLQKDPNIRTLFVSLKVLGGQFNTPDLRRGSPPIRVNETFKVPVEPGSRAQQELLRAMQFGDRKAADIGITLCWADSGSGDEGEPVAFGRVNLRSLWEGKTDLSAEPVELIDDQTQEVSTLIVSTAAMPTLQRIMPRGR